MRLCRFTFTFILPCLCTFLHAIPASVFIFIDFLSCLNHLHVRAFYPPCINLIFVYIYLVTEPDLEWTNVLLAVNDIYSNSTH